MINYYPQLNIRIGLLQILTLVLLCFPQAVFAQSDAETTKFQQEMQDYVQRISHETDYSKKMALIDEMNAKQKAFAARKLDTVSKIRADHDYDQVTKTAADMRTTSGADKYAKNPLAKKVLVIVDFNLSENTNTQESKQLIGFKNSGGANSTVHIEAVTYLMDIMGTNFALASDDPDAMVNYTLGGGYNAQSSSTNDAGGHTGTQETASPDNSKRPHLTFVYNGDKKWRSYASIEFKGNVQVTGSQSNSGESETGGQLGGAGVDQESGKCVKQGNVFTITGNINSNDASQHDTYSDRTHISGSYKMVIKPYEANPKYEAIIVPADPTKKDSFENWLPLGPALDGSTTKGNAVYLKVVVRDKKDTTQIYLKKYGVSFTLTSTNYPGYCSNFPMYRTRQDTKPDIRFDSSMYSNSIFTTVRDDMAQTDERGKDAVVCLRSYDYGGQAMISATVTLSEEGETYVASPYYDRSLINMSVPLDRNGNKIADAWEKKEGIYEMNLAADWDEDSKPKNGHYGDDILLLDEYRGFAVGKADKCKHERFSALTKDLVVISASPAWNNEFQKGCENYHKATTGVAAHMMTDLDFATTVDGEKARFPRWVNYNSPYKTHKTIGVVLWMYGLNQDASVSIMPAMDSFDHYWAIEYKGEASTINLRGTDDGNGGFLTKDVDYVVFRGAQVLSTLRGEEPYYPPNCSKDCGWYKVAPKEHFKHILYKYNINISPDSIASYIDQHLMILTREWVTAMVSHELGHASGIHHHHLADAPGDKLAFMKGVTSCPMRYWYNDDAQPCENLVDWVVMYLSGNWNPSAGVPGGTSYWFCNEDDDCFHQMRFK